MHPESKPDSASNLNVVDNDSQTCDTAAGQESQTSHPKMPSRRVCEPWRSGDPRQYPVPKTEDHWGHCSTLIRKYDKGMHDAWKDEIDKLLIFAGLFSAAVTAFTIESYKWLKEDPTDVSARVIGEMANLLRPSSVNITNARSSDSSVEPFVVSGTVVRINVFWFLSLTLSLTTVLIGILCMQWLREYSRDAALPHKDAIALRQMHYEGFLKWKVSAIISSLPLLLQSAVILFFAGLLELLWSLNRTVATIITIAISITVLFLFLTTFAPFLQYLFLGEKDFYAAQCPFKSPQSWAFYRLGLRILWPLTWEFKHTSWPSWAAFGVLKVRRSLHDQNWIQHDIRQWRRLRGTDDIIHGLSWINRTFTQSLDAVYSLYHCLQDLDIRTAAQIVSSLGPGSAEQLQSVLSDHTNQLAPQKRDNIDASFLGLHRHMHPSLGTFYLEAIVRILNTQDVRPFMDWPVRDLSILPNDIIAQFLMCIKVMIAHDRVTSSNVTTIWAIVQRVIRQVNWGTDELESHILLVFGIIEEFERWLLRSTPDLEQRHRVALCVYGVTKALRPSLSFHSLGPQYRCVQQAISLVKTLDECLVKMGGGPVILTPFVNQRWEELVARCSAPKRFLHHEALTVDLLREVVDNRNSGIDNELHETLNF